MLAVLPQQLLLLLLLEWGASLLAEAGPGLWGLARPTDCACTVNKDIEVTVNKDIEPDFVLGVLAALSPAVCQLLSVAQAAVRCGSGGQRMGALTLPPLLARWLWTAAAPRSDGWCD